MKRPEGFDRPRVPKPPAPAAPAEGADASSRRGRGSRPAAPVTPARTPPAPAPAAPTPPVTPRPRAAWRDDDEPDTEPIVLPHLAQAPVEAPPAPRTGREPTTPRAGGL
ncbi:hypothetical protein DOU00_14255, partial [Clavibacter michiganensis subsp. michiganensis]|nr:hypothetical protein [Clavibacter michiganensis subsp. michiganensis]